jgi:peptide/nickel transport system substrate-binding protein
VRTTFVRNGNYWGKIDGNAQEVIFTPIGNDATRVAALLSGEIDVMEPVPVQDIERINASPNAQGAAPAPSCAPSSWAWTRSATSCCTPA